jgi:hypothetical protein
MDPSGTNSSSSCVVSAKLASNGMQAIPMDWTIEPHNSLTVIHGANGDVSVGSRAPFKFGGKIYGPSDRPNRATFIGAAAPVCLGRALTSDEFFVSGVFHDQLNGQSVMTVHVADEANLIVGMDSQQTC